MRMGRLSSRNGHFLRMNLLSTFSKLFSVDSSFPLGPMVSIPHLMEHTHSFLIPDPNANDLLANLVQLLPILGLPWPTIVLAVGNSQPITKLIEHRDKYLGHTTQVNVYVGSFTSTQRETDIVWSINLCGTLIWVLNCVRSSIFAPLCFPKGPFD